MKIFVYCAGQFWPLHGLMGKMICCYRLISIMVYTFFINIKLFEVLKNPSWQSPVKFNNSTFSTIKPFQQ